MNPIAKMTSGFPALALGTDGLLKKDEFTDEVTREEVLVKKISYALKLGYRMFDTAEGYHTLAALGKAIKLNQIDRKEVKIVYKVNPAMEPQLLMQTLEKALEGAGGYLDVVMLHETNEQQIVLRALAVLQQLVNNGKAGGLGLSNTNHFELPFYTKEFKIVCVQNEFTLANYTEQTETLQFCVSNTIAYMGFSILRAMPQNETLTQIASKLQCTPAQVLLAWAREMHVIQAVSSSQLERIKENWDSLEVVLNHETVISITELAKIQPTPTPNAQIGNAMPQNVPQELQPFYLALQQLAQMTGNEAENAIDTRKIAAITQWNSLLEQAQKEGFNPAVKGLLKFKRNWLAQQMEGLQKDTGFCTAPKLAKPILEFINEFLSNM